MITLLSKEVSLVAAVSQHTDNKIDSYSSVRSHFCHNTEPVNEKQKFAECHFAEEEKLKLYNVHLYSNIILLYFPITLIHYYRETERRTPDI